MKNSKSNALFFEEKYKRHFDPWGFASSEYEQHRYECIFNALKHKHYHRIFEPGCSIGVLTEKVAKLANYVDAVDISPTAVKRAQERCLHLPSVSIRCESLANVICDKQTDLVILSEIGYYFGALEWKNIVLDILQNLSHSTTVLAVHWLGMSEDHVLSGDEVHNIIGSIKDLDCEYSERHNRFRLNRWVKK